MQFQNFGKKALIEMNLGLRRWFAQHGKLHLGFFHPAFDHQRLAQFQSAIADHQFIFRRCLFRGIFRGLGRMVRTRRRRRFGFAAPGGKRQSGGQPQSGSKASSHSKILYYNGFYRYHHDFPSVLLRIHRFEIGRGEWQTLQRVESGL